MEPESIAKLGQNLTFVEGAGLVSLEAESFTSNTPQGGYTWSTVTTASPSGGSALLAGPDNGAAVNTGYTTGSPRLDFQVTFAQTGTYQVWVRGRAAGSVVADSDSVHVGLDGQALASADRITGFTSSFGWSRSTMDNVNATLSVTSTGNHTVNVWMREEGFVVDKVILAKDASYTPSGNGPIETSTTSCNPATYEAENMSHSTGNATLGGWNIYSNGNISTNHTFLAGAGTLTVTAKGSVAAGVWPHMVVSIGGTTIGTATVNTTSWTTYSFPYSTTTGSKLVVVAFDNDAQSGGEDRNLYVDKAVVACTGAASTCTDTIQNGVETGTDCGGPSCGPCGNGQGCAFATDCASHVCTASICQAPTCSDTVPNGNETGTDCGGGTCDGCLEGATCTQDGDCLGNACSAGACGPVNSAGPILTVTAAFLEGTELTDSALVATNTLRVADRARVNATTGYAPVVNLGFGQTQVGVQAHVGSMASRAGIDLRNQATVHGNARSAGAITYQPGAVVQGTATQNATIPPNATFSWTVGDRLQMHTMRRMSTDVFG